MQRRTLKDICSDALDTPVSTQQGAKKSEKSKAKDSTHNSDAIQNPTLFLDYLF